jgi:hypothetical protein
VEVVHLILAAAGVEFTMLSFAAPISSSLRKDHTGIVLAHETLWVTNSGQMLIERNFL